MNKLRSISETLSAVSCEKVPHQEEEIKGLHPLAQWLVGRRRMALFDGLKALQS